MAVYDRWHTRKPRQFDDDGTPITCEHRADGRALFPSADHGCDKRWQVRWRDPDGRQCKRNFAKKAGKNPNVHADAFNAKIQGELTAGTYTDPAAAEVTLAEFAQQWRANLTGKPSNLKVIDKRLAHIIDVEPVGRRVKRFVGTSTIGDRTMGELARRPQLVQDWIKSLETRGLSAQYIQHIAGTLSTIFISATENGIVDRNPVRTRTVTLPPVRPRLIVPWTAKQIQAAAESLGNAIPYLGAGAGLREGEIFGFAREDIDDEEGIVRIRRQVVMVDGVLCFAPPKRDKVRDAPLSSSLSERLREQMEQVPPVKVRLPWIEPGGEPVAVHLVFTRPGGRPFYSQPFAVLWDEARAAAGVPATRQNGTHAMRHTFASACLASGVDIRTLAAWLGHDDPGFTLRVYGHLMPSAAARGRAAIDTFFQDL